MGEPLDIVCGHGLQQVINNQTGYQTWYHLGTGDELHIEPFALIGSRHRYLMARHVRRWVYRIHKRMAQEFLDEVNAAIERDEPGTLGTEFTLEDWDKGWEWLNAEGERRW